MKKSIIKAFTIYAFLSIILLGILPFFDMRLAGLDICLAFFISGVFCCVSEKNKGLDIYHLFLFVGFIGIIITLILLFMEDSFIADFIVKYGFALIPISFIIAPIYVVYIIPISKYRNIIKTNYFEEYGTCVEYISSSSPNTNGASTIGFSPVFEVFINGKKKKVHNNVYYSYGTVKKYYPIGVQTKIIINKDDYDHFFIFKTDKDKKRIPRTVIIFVGSGIISLILFFYNVL